MRSSKLFATVVAVLMCAPALADDVKVGIGISGWTGFAPLTLPKEAGIFKKNGLDVSLKKIPQKDRHLTIAAGDIQCAATTVEPLISGQNDAAMTYEPYLSTVRDAPDKGKIIATTLDYPMVMDTFGCTPKFLSENPKAAQALANSYFEALDMIAKDQAKAYEIMGADVKQSGEQFGNSAKYLRWQDKVANQKFFVGEFHQVDLSQRCASPASPIAEAGRAAIGVPL